MNRIARRNAFVLVALLSLLAIGRSAQALPSPSGDPLEGIFLTASATDLPESSLFTPQPLPMCGPICRTVIHHTSVTITGSGGSCSAAQGSLNSQLENIASTNCLNTGWLGSCAFAVHDTVACTQTSPGVYQVQGYATYSCEDTNC